MSDFARKIATFATTVRTNSDRVVQGVTARIVTAISDRNHVITGRMVGNWRVGINTIDTTFDEKTMDPARSAMKARNLPIAARTKAGDVVNISNHTPYAVFEEFGTSKRAGHPVIRSVAAEIPLYVRDVVAKARSAG